jgi:SAM-dependent methyltransferase
MRSKEWLYSIKQEKDTKKEELRIIRRYANALGSTLDLGCGSGYVLSRLNGERIGIDNDSEALRLCRRRGLKVFKIDLNRPFNLKRKFDTIICLGVLEHLTNPETAVQSVYKHLKDDGIFIASVPYHGLIKNLIIAMFDFDSHYHYTDWHLRFFTPNTFKELLSKFRILEMTKIGRFYPFNKSMVVVCRKGE